MILIAHEAPTSIATEVQQYTDFDYCLVHLLKDNPNYRSFFHQSILKGREVLLDNSIFELKKSFDPVEFAAEVEMMEPSYYIVPDSLDNKKETIQNFKNWKRDYNSCGSGLKIGVVQGETLNDVIECYKYMADNADYIALSFDMKLFEYVGLGNTKLERQCCGRPWLILTLINKGIWAHSKPHHLLGNSLAIEMQYYRNILGIRSVDTSNPVMAGIKGMDYIRGIGLIDSKPSGLLADLINIDVDQDARNAIIDNIQIYREIVTGYPQ